MNEEELKLLVSQGKSSYDISLLCNKSPSTIRRMIRYYGLKSLCKPGVKPNSNSNVGGKICPKCNQDKPLTEFYTRRQTKASSWCKSCSIIHNREIPAKWNIKSIIDNIQQLIVNGLTNKEISIQLKIPRETLPLMLKKYNILPNKNPPIKHTIESKLLQSIKRKEWLKNNPDKHPWKRHDKFKSEPCEKLKEWLTSKNIDFISEYSNHGISDRYFSIDVAFPDKMIALEINGNQHYNRDNTLKPYYLEREQLLIDNGWKVYQLHYSMCYALDKLETIILELVNSPVKVAFDYKLYVKRKKVNNCIDCGDEIQGSSKRCKPCRIIYVNNNKLTRMSSNHNYTDIRKSVVNVPRTSQPTTKLNYCIECGIDICYTAIRCQSCASLKTRKVTRPTKEILHNLIWSNSLVSLGVEFGVSDVSVKKWCKSYGLTIPDSKYRGRLHSGSLIDYQI
jgi:DNA-binding CsgD family transcriptional regulator